MNKAQKLTTSLSLQESARSQSKQIISVNKDILLKALENPRNIP